MTTNSGEEKELRKPQNSKFEMMTNLKQKKNYSEFSLLWETKNITHVCLGQLCSRDEFISGMTGYLGPLWLYTMCEHYVLELAHFQVVT